MNYERLYQLVDQYRAIHAEMVSMFDGISTDVEFYDDSYNKVERVSDGVCTTSDGEDYPLECLSVLELALLAQELSKR